MKSFSRIHQQAINILLRITPGNDPRNHRRFHAAVIDAHNRYLDNICKAFGAKNPAHLTISQYHRPVSREIYTL